MKPLVWLICSWIAALAQNPVTSPYIRQDPINAASYMSPQWPGSGVALGSLFVVKGGMLGPSELVMANSFPLKTQLSGTSLTVTVGSKTITPFVLYTSWGQVAALLPSNTPTGPGSLTVTYAGQTTPAVPIQVVTSSFGIFTRNEGGTGPGIIQNVTSSKDWPVNSLTIAAHPNQTMNLWGTGLGPVTGAEEAKPLPGDMGIPLDVFVGGKPAKVLYKGRSGCCAGVDQIVFLVPPQVEGCYVPVAVRVNGAVSNFVTMSIASDGDTCADLPTMTTADVHRMQNTNTVSLARIELTRLTVSVSAPGMSESASTEMGFASFTRYRADQALRSTDINTYFRAGAPSPGACVVLPANSIENEPLPFYEDPYSNGAAPDAPLMLNAGDSLQITGSQGAKQLSWGGSAYWASLGGMDSEGNFNPLYLEPGAYTIDNGNGGQDVGAFKATLTVPQPVVWLNEDSISEISRDKDLTITWSSANPSKELVTVIGLSSSTTTNTPTALLCTERASAGGMTIPAWTLSSLIQSDTYEGLPMGFLGIMNSPLDSESRFQAPGIDSGLFQYLFCELKNVNFQCGKTRGRSSLQSQAADRTPIYQLAEKERRQMRHTMRVLDNAIALLLVVLLCHQIGMAQVDPWERVKLIEQEKNA